MYQLTGKLLAVSLTLGRNEGLYNLQHSIQLEFHVSLLYFPMAMGAMMDLCTHSASDLELLSSQGKASLLCQRWDGEEITSSLKVVCCKCDPEKLLR